MLFFKNLGKAIVKGPDHIVNLSSQVNDHLTAASAIVDLAAEFAKKHDGETNDTVAALQNAIDGVKAKNNQVQAKANELSALAQVIGAIVRP